MEIDARIEDRLTVEPHGSVYRLARVGWKNEEEAQGRHHIYIDVVDDQGRRLAGERVTMVWNGGSSVGVVEEKVGEPFGANFPMHAALGSYSTFAGTDPALSDRVGGMGLGTPEHPGALLHTCFELVFVKYAVTPSPVDPPDPGLEPDPPQDDLAVLRGAFERIRALAMQIMAEVDAALERLG